MNHGQPAPKVTLAWLPTPKLGRGAPVTNFSLYLRRRAVEAEPDQLSPCPLLRYQRWEDFAQQLDKPWPSSSDFQPSFFERIGLRYVNAFSRRP